MKNIKLYMLIALFGLAIGTTGTPAQAKTIKIAFATHSSASNSFWQAVNKGYDDACGKIKAKCTLLFTQNEGSIPQQIANLEAAVAKKPDAIFTTIVDDKAYDAVIDKATKSGIKVLAVNVDDSEGADGNSRVAYVGQGFRPAGYALGKAISEYFPKTGPINVLVGISAPGQNWSELRGGGVIDFLNDFKKNNPGREVNINRIDSATDLAITSERVGAYLNAHPETTAYFDTGYWGAGVARVLKDRKIAPGKVLIGGFDLVPEVLQQMKNGYVQVQVDQQPYMQGFLPVMQVYLNSIAGLAFSDMETGKGLVKASEASKIISLSAKGLR